MSENYSPAPGLESGIPLSTVLLSQRDLGLRVPINYVTDPGVSLTAACFARLRYEDDTLDECLSNLLAVGLRRFELDLYWDENRSLWSFCPVSIPTSIPDANSSSTITPTFSSTTLAALTPDAEPVSDAASSSRISRLLDLESSSNARVRARQTGSNSISSSSSRTSTTSIRSATSLGETLPSVSSIPEAPDVPLISIGPYVCTTTINLSVFTNQLLDYIQRTQNTLGAHLIYVTVNVHAASSASTPRDPAPAPSNLPGPPNLLGTLFSGNLSAYTYSETNLKSDRANLNSSWYRVAERYRPIDGYYRTSTSQYGIVSTEDGWPSESYIEFSRSKRLLLGWGTIDPQMSGYNFSGDTGILFPNSYIQDVQSDLLVSDSGAVTQGCFLRNDTINLSQVNASWAVDASLLGFDYPLSQNPDLNPLLRLTSNITSCGISPILNNTLLNLTAHQNYIPYSNFSSSTIWSWAASEPANSSNSLYRCATIDPGNNNHWTVTDCSQKYRAACRVRTQPYNWTLTSYPISYSFAADACPDGYEFEVPRTALENSYLGLKMRSLSRGGDERYEDKAWLDFNSLDIKGCWTVGGPNATCPYTDSLGGRADYNTKIVVVPTVAAVIVLAVTALTVFVKAAGNRQVRKRSRKRLNNGFVYEGVPS